MRYQTKRAVGFTIVELLIVLAIIGVLIGILIPAVQRARMSADRTSCLNNLHQIGLAGAMYLDSAGVFPAARLCPSPWFNGDDVDCRKIPSPDTYTGPNELWWLPYDNRPGTTVTHALPGYIPQGLLWPFLENSPGVLQCPTGLDWNRLSATYGQRFQVSYAMNPFLGGKKIVELRNTSGLFLAWEHDDLPTCLYRKPNDHWTSWTTNPALLRPRHYAGGRHGGVFNVCYADGHADSRTPD